MKNIRKKYNGLRLLIIAILIIFGFVCFGQNNIVHADVETSIPLAGGISLADSSQNNGSYLTFPAGWVDSADDLGRDIILDRLGFNLYSACAGGNSDNQITFTDKSPFKCYKHNAGSENNKIDWDPADDNDYYTVGTPTNIGTPTINTNDGDQSIPGTITMIFKKAARTASGNYIPVKITITNVVVRKRGPSANDKEGTTNSIAILTGFSKADWENEIGWYRPISKGGYGKEKNGIFDFSSFWYHGYHYSDMGVKYNVKVELDNGSSSTVYKMPWLFSDIDQPDAVSNADRKRMPYSSSTPFAEHVKITGSNNVTDDKRYIYGYSASSSTGLSVASDGAVYYPNTAGTTTYSADVLFLIKAPHANFEFEWGGTDCSTEITDAPSVVFRNSTTIYYGGKPKSNNTDNIIVHSAEHSDIRFDHSIIRDEKASDFIKTASTGYKISVGNNSGDSSEGTTKGLTPGGSQTFKETIKGADNLLLPDEHRIVWQTIDYQPTNINNGYVPKPDNNNCTLLPADGRQCIGIYRPEADFEGTIKAVAVGKNDSGGTIETQEKVISTSTKGKDTEKIEIKLPSSSGKYSIEFTQDVTRSDNGKDGTAGDKVATKITSYTQKKDYFRWRKDYEKDNKGTKNNTKGLTDNNVNVYDHDMVWAPSYSSKDVGGELYYGETIEYCNYLEVYTKQKIDVGQTPVTRKICVTISRAEKQCDIAPNGTRNFGVRVGQNLGRIGVKNYTNGQELYTKVDPLTESVGLSSPVYAKPGDSIQFIHDMCAGAFYTAEVNQLGSQNNPNYGSRYGAVGKMTRSDEGDFMPQSPDSSKYYLDGYLFKDTIPTVGGKYTNPGYVKDHYGDIDGERWRWTNGPNAGKMMSGDRLMSSIMNAEDTYKSPEKSNNVYKCTHDASENKILDNHYVSDTYQVSGKEKEKDGNSKCHTDIVDSNGNNKFDVGGTISQSLYWNNLRIEFWSTNNQWPIRSVSGSHEKRTATAYVQVPYNYILKPYVENKNGNDDTRVVYLGEEYKMNPGVVTSSRQNWKVTRENNSEGSPYATITKNTHVKVETYYEHGGSRYSIGGDEANIDDEVRRFNQNGYLESANDIVKEISFKIPDSDSSKAPAVGDKVCTTITVWPADSHDHPDALYTKQNSSIGGANGETNTGPYVNIALREDSVDREKNSRTTTSCSMVAKRPTMSVESGNAYSKSGYDMSRYTKNINAGDYNFSSWSEYGVFGKINKVDEHLISGAAVGYNRSSSYYGLNSEGQKKNKTRPNSGDVSTGSNLSSKTCIFETQTFANANCENKNAKTDEYGDPKNADIGGQSVTDYKQKILDRYRVDDKYKNVNCSSGSVQYGGESYCKVQDLGSGNSLKNYTKNNGSSAIVVKAVDDDIYIGNGASGSIPGAIPKYFTDETVGEGEDNQIDYNRTLVYDASGQSIVIDGDISYNSVGSKLDDIVGVVIIAKNVYFTDVPRHIDAVIIAENEVNTCKYAEGVEMKIGEGATLNSDVCNNELIFEAPVITKKLVLNRTHGAGNGVESIQRAEIFNLNMANYLWSFNQMSRYSQAVTTYSRELPSRY